LIIILYRSHTFIDLPALYSKTKETRKCNFSLVGFSLATKFAVVANE